MYMYNHPSAISSFSPACAIVVWLSSIQHVKYPQNSRASTALTVKHPASCYCCTSNATYQLPTHPHLSSEDAFVAEEKSPRLRETESTAAASSLFPLEDLPECLVPRFGPLAGVVIVPRPGVGAAAARGLMLLLLLLREGGLDVMRYLREPNRSSWTSWVRVFRLEGGVLRGETPTR